MHKLLRLTFSTITILLALTNALQFDHSVAYYEPVMLNEAKTSRPRPRPRPNLRNRGQSFQAEAEGRATRLRLRPGL